jgi:hypothetical protein
LGALSHVFDHGSALPASDRLQGGAGSGLSAGGLCPKALAVSGCRTSVSVNETLAVTVSCKTPASIPYDALAHHAFIGVRLDRGAVVAIWW